MIVPNKAFNVKTSTFVYLHDRIVLQPVAIVESTGKRNYSDFSHHAPFGIQITIKSPHVKKHLASLY